MKSCALGRVPAFLVLGTTSSVDIELWKTSIFHGFYHHVYPQCVLSCPSMKKATRGGLLVCGGNVCFRSGVRNESAGSFLQDWGS